jgi:hypothetical protein
LHESDRPKRDYEQDGTVFDHEGNVDVETTIEDREWEQKYRGEYVDRKPVPKKSRDKCARQICRWVRDKSVARWATNPAPLPRELITQG